MSDQNPPPEAGPSAPAAAPAASTPASPPIRVYLPPSNSAAASTSILPPVDEEEDLRPTPEELKQAFRSSILQRNGPDAPLLTRAMREKEEARLGLLPSSKNRVFNQVKIRIRFSDRTMIEKEFSESDTITHIYDFFADCVDPDQLSPKQRATASSSSKNLPLGNVTLYTTPPKQDYPRSDPKLASKTLRQLGLIPSAVINVRWSDPAMNSNSYPAPLKPALRNLAQALPTPPSSSQQQQDLQQQQHQQQASSSSSDSTQTKKPLPKWLKGIVKK